MSRSISISGVRAKPWSTTVQQFFLAVGCAFGALAVGVIIYVVEKYVFQVEHRFVENPGSVMMRSVGLSHFLLGWLFLFTSPRIRNGPAFGNLLKFTALGVLLCILTHDLGGGRNPFVFLFFYGYFLIHELRDQTHIHQTYNAAKSQGESCVFLGWLKWSATYILLSVLISGYLLYAVHIKHHAWLSPIPPTVFVLIGAVLFSLCAISISRTIRLGLEEYGSLSNMMQTHSDLFIVYGGIFCVLLLGAVLGAVSFNLIILIHAGAWVMFYLHRQRNSHSQPTPLTWSWFRQTQTGFVVLHISFVVILLVLMAIRVYVWRRVGFVSELLAGTNFPYWSLMHISMSFWRGK